MITRMITRRRALARTKTSADPVLARVSAHALASTTVSLAASRAALIAIVCASVVGCTSFAFKNKGTGGAPSSLQDRAAMVKLPQGTFEMGALNAEPDEYPPHKVEVSSFLIDKREVAAGDYQECVKARVCRQAELGEAHKELQDERHPIVGVNWYDAKKYCEWVGKRLPTEAEWEYAARAPRFGKYPWDGRFDPMKLNMRGTADGYEFTAPVGSFPAGSTGNGVQDMAGNASEWTADWYDAVWYSKLAGGADATTSAKTVTNPRGPEGSTGSKAVRGGSWSDTDYSVRTTVRLGVEPNLSNDAIGFRCAADK